jgi:NAD(P)-dependent dehydrogenase (short-subunit alcohol dehydrogenase family)
VIKQSPRSCSAFEKTIECFGGIDIVVINAGVNYDRRTVDNTPRAKK